MKVPEGGSDRELVGRSRCERRKELDDTLDDGTTDLCDSASLLCEVHKVAIFGSLVDSWT